MTAFPIRVTSRFSLIRQDHREEIDNRRYFTPVFSISPKDRCMVFRNIDEMDNIQWQLPTNLKSGRYRIEAHFCDDAWPDMPPEIQSPEFEIKTLPHP
jgi:hypothetical protein